MGREIIGEHVRLQFAKYPTKHDTCKECGALHTAYVKHPTLVGGSCAECGHVWLPAVTFSKATPIHDDDIQVTATDDGGATIRFKEA